MNETIPPPEESFAPPPSSGFRPWLPPWAVFALAVVGIAAVAEVGYRFYDQDTNPEVRLGGIARVGEPVSGQEAALSLTPSDAFRYLQIRMGCENASEADAEEARVGIPGTLRIIDETGNREWEMQFLLGAKADGVVRHTTVVAGAASAAGAPAIGLGTRYYVDYDFAPTGDSEEAYDDFFQTEFPAGTALRLEFRFSVPIGDGTRVYLSYSRLPRYLHQALFR